jgi:DNA replication protein DnaC
LITDSSASSTRDPEEDARLAYQTYLQTGKVPDLAAPAVTGCALCGAAQSICSGRGYVQEAVPYGHANFGKLLRCPRYVAVEESAIFQRQLTSHLEAYSDKTFETFKDFDTKFTTSERIAFEHASKTAFKYALQPNGWLIISGYNGTGKTHLAAAIGNYVLARNQQVLFMTAPDLFDMLRQSYQANATQGDYDATLERISTIPLLIIDDLGVENQSGWVMEKLFQILNHRYINRLPLVITTNLDVKQFPPRIASRLSDENFATLIPLKIRDQRVGRYQHWMQQITDLTPYHHLRFETFDVQTYTEVSERESLQAALYVARAYAAKPQGWLFYHGDPGTGKTHLVASIARAVSERGIPTAIMTVADLLDQLRNTFSEATTVDFDTVFQFVAEIDLLVLEDIHLEQASKWAREKLMQILDRRYALRRWTIMTCSERIAYENNPRLYVRLLDSKITTWISIKARPYVLRARMSDGTLPK